MGLPSTSQNATNADTQLPAIPILPSGHAVQKRKASSLHTSIGATHGLKRLKFNHDAIDGLGATHLSVPIGTQWQNNSCAYDAVFTVLFNIWHEDRASAELCWQELESDLLNSLVNAFNTHESIPSTQSQYSLEDIRDFMRR